MTAVTTEEFNALALQIAAHHGTTVEALLSQTRRKNAAHARHELMWTLRQMGEKLVRVGLLVGGRDHSAAHYGIKRHAARKLKGVA